MAGGGSEKLAIREQIAGEAQRIQMWGKAIVPGIFRGRAEKTPSQEEVPDGRGGKPDLCAPISSSSRRKDMRFTAGKA